MSPRIEAPDIDRRRASDLTRRLRSAAPLYTPEWTATEEDDLGVALIDVFSVIAEGVIEQLNRAPDKNFIEFLNMLGLRLLPARPAEVPVQFQVNPGLAKPVLIPERSRCSAPATGERQDDLPFETTADLWAIQSTLEDLVAVDPFEDKIYKPPPKFLDLTQATPGLPIYRTQSLSGEQSFQLDRVDGIKAGDILKIAAANLPAGPASGALLECNDLIAEASAETTQDPPRDLYLVVDADPEGRIVRLKDSLGMQILADTAVEKVTDFAVFEQVDLQEHILYLGHADLFNIENPAKLELAVKHFANSTAGLASYDILWQYGVESESGGVAWRDFDPTDRTSGLTRDGSITLEKKKKVEIFETEIFGRTSRWIRAKVTDKIPAVDRASPGADPPKLPRLDTLGFTIEAGGTPIQPDAAFHNDTPLEVEGFRPFGSEPRQFDRFYLGSSEAFSKERAKITLDVTLQDEPLLSTPAAVVMDNGLDLRVVARLPSGQLTLYEEAPNTPLDLDALKEHDGTIVAPGSTPAAIAIDDDRVLAFVRGEDGALYALVIPSDPNADSAWRDTSPPPSETIIYDPAVVRTPINDSVRVFTVGSDGELYSIAFNESDGEPSTGWVSHGSPPNGIGSSPTAVVDTTPMIPNPYVFVCDNLGVPFELNTANGNWSEVAAVPSVIVGEDPDVDEAARAAGAAPRSRLFAQSHGSHASGEWRLALRDDQNRLIELASGGVGGWVSNDLSTLTGPADIQSAPAGVYFFAEGGQIQRHLFVRATDDRLWHRTSDTWMQHSALGVKLHGNPGVALHTVSPAPPAGVDHALSVFVSTTGNQLARFRVLFDDRGEIGGAAHHALILQDVIDPTHTNFSLPNRLVYIVYGSTDESFPVDVARYDADRAIITVTSIPPAWPDVPGPSDEFRVAQEVTAGTAQSLGAGTDTIELEDDAVSDFDITVGMKVLVGDQARRITAIAGDEVTVDTNWSPVPALPTPTYRVIEDEYRGAVSARTARAVILDNAASDDDHYIDRRLILDAAVHFGEMRRIVSYSGQTQVATLLEPFTSEPEPSTAYEIVGPPPGSRGVEFFAPSLQEVRPELSWEYWNGDGWLALPRRVDNTAHLRNSGTIEFEMPHTAEQTDVAGQENFWIRSRLIGGDYGRETFKVVTRDLGGGETESTTVPERDGLAPPFIKSLGITYRVITEVPPEHCLAFNNLNAIDHTAACKSPGQPFSPFEHLEDRQLALYLGFDKPLEGGPVQTLFAASELDTEDGSRPIVTWSFRSENRWRELAGEDGTDGLVRTGLLSLQVPKGFQLRSLFGKSQYWLQGRLSSGSYLSGHRPLLKGVFPNAVNTIQAATTEREILGSSDGEDSQEFVFLPASVDEPGAAWSIIGQPEIRVREFLSPEEIGARTNELGEQAIETIDVLGEEQTWVLWTEVDDFFASKPESRHYRLDRARGRIRFGDGKRGMIPPAGIDNIEAFQYRSGGGDQGNVGTGEVSTLVTAIAGVDGVLNPIEAGGGGDVAPVEEMLEIGPARISHRRRAVTIDDFEWLAQEASRQVVKARCHANFRAAPRSTPEEAGEHEIGWVTVYVVPRTRDDLPRPTLQLQRVVERYLRESADLGLAAEERINVRPPRYVRVKLKADVFAQSLEKVAKVEIEAKRQLGEFLHPLRGGPEKRGWDFGRPVAASDLFVLLEAIEGLDHVENLELVALRDESTEETSTEGETSTHLVEVEPYELIAGADPDITMDFVGRAP